ncbi:MAG: BspA family leucine-rich repeat surface protein [Clostridia bacterium]
MPKEALKNLKETNEGRKVKMRKMLKNKNGITLIALVVTIVVLLILAGVTLNLVLDNNGIIQKSKEARSETIVADEKEKVEMAYVSAALKKLGDTVTAEELQEELDSSVGAGKTVVTTNGDDTLNVLFNATGNNYNVDNGAVEKIEIDNTKMAIFDTGKNVAKKMYALAPDGYMKYAFWVNNLSIDGIKKYKGTPDLTKMTEANIVSWTEGYNAYEQNPSAYKSMIPEGTKLCPIYMWFEESGEEIRGMDGSVGLTEITNSNTQKKVKTGTIYWWSESQNVYLNPDSSRMFWGLSYLADIRGLSSLKTNYTNNMSYIFCVTTQNQKLKNFDALSNWNTESVTNLSCAFAGYKNLESIEGLTNWNTSKVTNMHGMLGGDLDVLGSKIKDISPLKNWNVSNVVDMSYIFSDIRSGGFVANNKLECKQCN